MVVEADGREVEAHCPNPGRLRELLKPGRTCLLQREAGQGRKTGFSLQAVEYSDVLIPLNSVGANRIAEKLILPRLYPRDSLRPEYRLGGSRFDFLASPADPPVLIEVKACTLCEEGTAMFPDAPSLRAVKHLRELAALAQGGEYRARVLFVISNPTAERFVPGIHTDPQFALALEESSPWIDLQAAVVECDSSGDIRLVKDSIPIELLPARAARADSGAYLLRLRLNEPRPIEVGALGRLTFAAGEYIYVGSAMKGVTKRVERHLRRRKRFHWHIDYLREAADRVSAFPIRSLKRLECSLAMEIAPLAVERIDSFGASDCSCPTHFFRVAPDDPRLERLLLRYRHREAL